MRPIVSDIFPFGCPAIVDSIVLCRLASDREPGFSPSDMNAAVATPVSRVSLMLRFADTGRLGVLSVELPLEGRIYLIPGCPWDVQRLE